MHALAGLNFPHLLSTYGYWAVFALVAIESIGIPAPGETILVTAAVYAGASHALQIEFVISAATLGAIVGDNVGYMLGRTCGVPLLARHGARFGLHEPRLKIGRYLFRRHGGKVVFFGRFVAFLRAFAALLAGSNRMPWWRFLAFNTAGGVVWALIFGVGGYLMGKSIERVAGPVAVALAVAVLVAAIIGAVVVRKSEARLLEQAEKAAPSPLRG